MKKLISALGVGATVAAAVLGGVTTASAATQSTPAKCATAGFAWTNARIAVRSGPGTTYPIVIWVNAGTLVSCYPVVAGGKYGACGYPKANGWLPVDVIGDARIDGYLPSTCMTDA